MRKKLTLMRKKTDLCAKLKALISLVILEIPVLISVSQQISVMPSSSLTPSNFDGVFLHSKRLLFLIKQSSGSNVYISIKKGVNNIDEHNKKRFQKKLFFLNLFNLQLNNYKNLNDKS
jgi:hypothetical protein